VNGILRGLAWGLFGAAIGFTVALATSRGLESHSARRDAAGRNVGGTKALRFTNPFLIATNQFPQPAFDPLYPVGGDVKDDPDGFDLGDVALGSTLLRYVNVSGGLMPYTLDIRPLLGSSLNIGGPAVPVSLPTLSQSGKLTGLISPLAGTVLRFDVDLVDAVGSDRFGRFKLNLLPANTSYRHAMSLLPIGVLGDTYHTNLETVGGAAPSVYSIQPGTLRFNGQLIPRIEDVGLTLTPDGYIIGRPAIAGAVSFVIQATDGLKFARSRDARTIGQDFFIRIEPNGITTTELVASQVQIRGNRDKAGGDSFSYSGVLDTKGDINPTLAGEPVVLRIGGATFTGKFDAKGKLKQAFADKGRFTVSLSQSTGAIRIKVTNANLSAGIGADAFQTKTTSPIILALEIGRLRTCEALQMPTVVSTKRFQLEYKLGTNRGVSVGGGFQIVSVKGLDGKDRDANEGDRWLVRFIGLPRGIEGTAAADAVKAGTSCTIRVGTSFVQTMTLALKNVRLEFKSTSSDPGIFRLLLDPRKFLHRLETNVLPTVATDIPIAFENTDAASLFPLGMDIKGFNGDTGRVIIRGKQSWVQR
jgi:hypothetical protein